MTTHTILTGKNHKVELYDAPDDEDYLDRYHSTFNNVPQSHHNLMSFLLEKTAEWYISQNGELSEKFFSNLQNAAQSADWAIATVYEDGRDYGFPYPIPTIGDGTIALTDWLGREYHLDKYQLAAILLIFLFQRGEDTSFFKTPMLINNPYKTWKPSDELPVSILVKTIADEQQWSDVFSVID